MDTYLTIAGRAEGLYKEKGSKFISFAYPVSTTDEVKEILAEVRKRYYDARHVCYAYVLGHGREVFRANDDGEPSGTAGRPILGQINSCGLTDVLVVVVRYFGGVLLGTGGLVQAYKAAAGDALSQASVEERIVERVFEATFGYEQMNGVMRVIKDFNLSITGQRQEMDCCIRFRVRLSDIDAVTTRFEKLDFVKFSEVESEQEAE